MRIRTAQMERRIKASATDALGERMMSQRNIAGMRLPSDGSHTTGGKRTAWLCTSLAKKNPCRAAAGVNTQTAGLEDNLRTQLDVERFARPQTRGSVEVADGVLNRSTGRAGSTHSGGQIDV